MGFSIELFTVLFALGVYLYFKWRKSARYFADRGVPYVKGNWPLGSDMKESLKIKNTAFSMVDLYNELEPHKVGGIFKGTTPMYVVRDPEYVRRIYTADFGHFVDRFREYDLTSSPLEQHLFKLTGNKWRFLRGKLSPAFTSGKLRLMSDEMNRCSDLFVSHLCKTVPLGKDFDLNDDVAGFTIQVIGSCAFGIETNSIGNPEATFRKFARDAFPDDIFSTCKQILRAFFPWIFKVLKVRFFPLSVENFVLDLVHQSFAHRKTTGFKRNDFIQLLLELREKGSVELGILEADEEDEGEIQEHTNDEYNKAVMDLDDGLLGAQLFIFLVAGFETTASTINHLIYLLSQNLDCQEKAREEARVALAKHGNYSYDMTRDMTYLDDCIDETLRLFPPLAFNFRVCTKDYTFPNGIKIEKGELIVLPTYPLQHDPKLYPNPEKFIPGRISVKGSYAPFGDGPRVCIGKRFALLEIKLAVARILNAFQINPCNQKIIIDFKPAAFLLKNKTGFPVQLQKIS